MKITILTFGSRGDVEPYLALAHGLKNAGHSPTLVAPRSYRNWIESYGVRCHPMRFDLGEFTRAHVQSPNPSRNPLKRARQYTVGVAAGNAQSLEDYREACADADLIVQTGAGHGGVEIARHRGIPMIFSYLYPYAPTREFPSYFFPWRRSFGGAYNIWTQRLALHVTWRTYGKAHNRWRAEHFGLPPWTTLSEMLSSEAASGTPTLYAYSRNVLPKPLDWQSTDHVTGYFVLPPDPEWTPPVDLVRFLEAGAPPVYVGFGSMPQGDPAQLARSVVDALKAVGQRGIVLTGGGKALVPVEAPETVVFVDSVSHAWLFPRMAAIVHHGGAGTTAHALRAGVPSVVTPFALDQFSWGERVEALGVGVRGPNLPRLRADNLAAAIVRATSSASLRSEAARLGTAIRAENGVARAVELIERHAEEFHRRQPRSQPIGQPAN